MIINNDLTSFTVLDDSPLSDALNLININKSGFVLVIDLKGKLVGIITDGDFRRWMLKNGPSLDVQASVVANKDVVTAPWKERVPLSEIQHLFSEAIKHLPLVDRSGRLMAVASGTRLVEMKIGQKVLSEDAPAFLIAEIGNNHNGSVERAFKLVDLAFNAGADCAKFQMRDLNSLYTGANYVSGSEDLGSEYTIDLLKRFQLNDEEMFRVFDYCKTKGILPLCTPWDEVSLDKLEKYRMAAYKVASADLTNHRLIERLCETRKPLIVSTGMSMEDEIKETVAIFQQKAASFALLHCNSTYPAPFKDLNLQFINRLKEIGQNCLVGYSGHERGYFIPVAAVALGAKIIEKHFTMSKSMEGNDHKVSLLPHEFSAMVDDIRNTEEAIGGNTTRKLSQGELINREVLGKSLVAAQEIKKGTALSKDLLTVRGPGKGIQPNRINELLGVVVKRNINEGDYIFDSDISEDQVTADNYSFNRPFGIPIRFHDYEKLACCSNLDFVEFHLSYNDLDLELSKYIGKKSEIGFAVHSPELFKGDHILDLCSDDDDYRQQSISNLLRVIDKTEELKAYFPAEKRPVIIVNVGGWSENGFIDASDKKRKYEMVAQAINTLQRDSVELTVQTMPPFPWHFGGQRYHNLFVLPNEIVDFCNSFGVRVTLDVSHSFLACNFYQYDFDKFIENVGPFATHLHIADAQGTDGEGLQIGDGLINFEKMSEILKVQCPDATFIPEVWQGHTDNGVGFWTALDRLQLLKF